MLKLIGMLIGIASIIAIVYPETRDSFVGSVVGIVIGVIVLLLIDRNEMRQYQKDTLLHMMKMNIYGYVNYK